MDETSKVRSRIKQVDSLSGCLFVLFFYIRKKKKKKEGTCRECVGFAQAGKLLDKPMNTDCPLLSHFPSQGKGLDLPYAGLPV